MLKFLDVKRTPRDISDRTAVYRDDNLIGYILYNELYNSYENEIHVETMREILKEIDRRKVK